MLCVLTWKLSCKKFICHLSQHSLGDGRSAVPAIDRPEHRSVTAFCQLCVCSGLLKPSVGTPSVAVADGDVAVHWLLVLGGGAVFVCEAYWSSHSGLLRGGAVSLAEWCCVIGWVVPDVSKGRENKGNAILRNVRKYSPDDAASRRMSPGYSATLPLAFSGRILLIKS